MTSAKIASYLKHLLVWEQLLDHAEENPLVFLNHSSGYKVLRLPMMVRIDFAQQTVEATVFRQQRVATKLHDLLVAHPVPIVKLFDS